MRKYLPWGLAAAVFIADRVTKILAPGIPGEGQTLIPGILGLRYAENKDLYVGLFKAFLFGLIIVDVACFQGFSAREGAVGVGRATRHTVIISFLTILVVGYFVTRLFYQ